MSITEINQHLQRKAALAKATGIVREMARPRSEFEQRLDQKKVAERAQIKARQERSKRRHRAAFVGLSALTGLVGYNMLTEEESKPTVPYIMQPGDRGSTVAREFNPEDGDIRPESDQIQSQDPNGDGKWEGGELVDVPYTELPEGYTPPAPEVIEEKRAQQAKE